MACVRIGRRFWWPDGRIPYEINLSDFPAGSGNRNAVLSAIEVWNTETIIRLVPHDNETNFVEFVAADDTCSSPVGMQGQNRQTVGCDVGDRFDQWSVVHEIGHAIGLRHEHTRLDRDDWVTVHWSNIKPGKEGNFEVDTTNRRDVCRYDYDSLMHYSRFGFPIDESEPTLTPNDDSAEIGQSDHLSATDKRAILFLHGTYSLLEELWKGGFNPAAGVARALPNGGSVREWIVC